MCLDICSIAFMPFIEAHLNKKCVNGLHTKNDSHKDNYNAKYVSGHTPGW